MISLTYLSTAAVPFDAADLHELLIVSRRNNHARGLTGMLLHVDGHFIQTLEGDADDVEGAFATIAADPRHHDVFITWRESIAERTFPDWSMGFEDVDPDQRTATEGLNDFLAAKTEMDKTAAHLGNPGVFHRIFRDRMR